MPRKNIRYSKRYAMIWFGSGFSLLAAGILMVLTYEIYFISIIGISFFYIYTGKKIYDNPIAYVLEENTIYINPPARSHFTLKCDEVERTRYFLNYCILNSTEGYFFLNFSGISKKDKLILINYLNKHSQKKTNTG